VGISETRIQQTGPQPNWKKLFVRVSHRLCLRPWRGSIGWDLRSPEKDTGDGDITESGYALAFDRRLNTAVNTNQIHDEALSSTGPQKTPTASERVGNEDEEDGATDDLDHTVHSSGQETSLSTGNTEVLKDLRSVVVLFQESANVLLFFFHS
jgi:hypothetical protein